MFLNYYYKSDLLSLLIPVFIQRKVYEFEFYTVQNFDKTIFLRKNK